MVRSLGFGSNPADLMFGLLTLAFTMPPGDPLGLPTKLTRWIVLQKARRHLYETKPTVFSHRSSAKLTLKGELAALFPFSYDGPIDLVP